MTSDRKGRIETAFGAAADRYDDHAGVQRVVARTVADLVGQVDVLGRLPSHARVLEIGCGTGMLTRELQVRWPHAELTVTDLSPAMIGTAAKSRMLAGAFLPMDGEHPWFDGQWFDLIVSSLAFQWFDDMPVAVARLFDLLRPGGSLIFSTMAERSFTEWREAHGELGMVAGTPDYPSLSEFRRLTAAYPDGAAFDEDYVVDFGNGRGFLGHLQGIGATVAVEGRVPLTSGELRRVLKVFEAKGAHATYHVVFVRLTRPST